MTTGSFTWIDVTVRIRRERFCSAAGASMNHGSSSGPLTAERKLVHAVYRMRANVHCSPAKRESGAPATCASAGGATIDATSHSSNPAAAASGIRAGSTRVMARLSDRL